MIRAVVERASRLAPPPKRRLRELGIYMMPDGRELVASTLYSDGCCLYAIESWETYRNSEFLLDRSGRLLRRGRPTPWTVLDLKDSGRTTNYPRPIIS
jgi:hypothetical protein